ncbi:MAG TPA: integrase arm-type DNA-binding domain-containing protein, partial [Gammaproteobacteria bacterium]|nr:integrase arm-type DNA-binding domain-containing protein [Gammaproteobacteria bacterium]
MTRRISGKLFSVEIARGMNPGLYSDGGNLWLQVSKIGSKSWLFRYTLNGRSRAMGLGALHTVSLSEARDKATACRKLLVAGIDPIVARDADAARQAMAAANSKTFDECAAAYIAVHSPEWRNAKHSLQWTATIATYASPTIGKLPIKDVTSARVLEVLEPIWNTKPETAARLRGRIESVWNWAKARKYCTGDNPATWRGNLKDLLPALKKSERVKHHPALPYEQMGEFMVKLHKESGTAARALEFLILTATRTNEVTGARWDEVDLAKETWTIPGERMKAKRAHRIP